MCSARQTFFLTQGEGKKERKKEEEEKNAVYSGHLVPCSALQAAQTHLSTQQ